MSVPYTPVAQVPLTPGQLSNTRGRDFAGDILPFTWRYRHPRGSADKAGQVRLQSVRLLSAAGGPVQSPQVLWDTGYTGAPTITPLPTAVSDAGIAEINHRVYVTGGIDASGNIRSEVWSAPLNGGSVGTWRQEKPLGLLAGTGPANTVVGRYAHGCTTATFGATGGQGSAGVGVGGVPWLICYGGFTQDSGTNATGHCIAARILPDGTLDHWITLTLTSASLAYLQLVAVPNQYLTSGLVLSGGVPSTGGAASASIWATAVRGTSPNAQWIGDWDTPRGWWIGLPNHAQVAGHHLAFDWAAGVLILFKGSDNNATAWPGFSYLPFWIDINAWNWGWGGGWTAATTSGSVAQSKAGFMYLMSAGVPGQAFFFFFGGTSAVSITDRASALTTVQYGRITWVSGAPSGTVVFQNSAFPLGTAACGLTTVAHDYGYDERGPVNYPPPILDRPKGWFSVLGGQNAGNAALTTDASTSIPVSTSNPYQPFGTVAFDIGAWKTGVGSGLAAGDLGTSGSLVSNLDGSQDFTINHGGVDGAAIYPEYGDLIQVNAWSTDVNGGDPSPAGSTLVRIGQAPTVTNLAVSSTATGQPLLSWAFNGGSGGQAQFTWRAVVTRNSDSVVVFDSGVVPGVANNVQVRCAPMLASGIAHTATVTVTSLDNPVAGSTATATASLAINQTLSGVPATPSGLSLGFDATNKWLLLSGTAAASTTAVRIYYRDSLVGGNFRLYAEVAQAIGAFAYKLMDKLSLGRSFDFQVSALGGSAASESALSATLSSTIPVDLDSPSGFLHLAGQPLTGALGVAVKGQAQYPMVAAHDSKTLVRYNASRALVRQGTLDVRRLELSVFSAYSSSVATLDLLRNQLLAGGVVWWRDRNGVTLPMALESPEDVKTLHPNHRDFVMRLVQVDDTYSPYVSSGSAVGIPTLANGSIPPLNPSVEQVA